MKIQLVIANRTERYAGDGQTWREDRIERVELSRVYLLSEATRPAGFTLAELRSVLDRMTADGVPDFARVRAEAAEAVWETSISNRKPVSSVVTPPARNHRRSRATTGDGG